MTYFILFHFLPIFLVLIGFFAKAFFFYKIKWPLYRICAIPTTLISIWYVTLVYKDLSYTFYTGALIDKESLAIGNWERYYVIKIFDEIKFDILFYYLYCNRKIISYKFRFKDLIPVIEDPKSFKYTLLFLICVIFLVMVFLESLFNGGSGSVLIELIKELKKR